MSGVEAAIGFGASVLGIASAGISVATTLIRFSVSYKGSTQKIEDLSSRVSLTATILTTVGNTIEGHKDYFKEDNFRDKFGRVTDRCKRDYEALGNALHKAKSEANEVGSETWVTRKMTPWRKLMWALGGEEQMKDLQSSLEESKSQVLMMQSAASLIVLQIIGRRRALTEDENIDLAELKQKMGLLLAAFQDAKLLSVLPIGTSNLPVIPDRAPSNEELEMTLHERALQDQIKALEAEKEALRVGKGIDHELPNKDIPRDGSLASEADPVLFERGSHDSARRASIRRNERVPNRGNQYFPPPAHAPFYEAWALTNTKTAPKQKTIQIFGLKMKIKETDSQILDVHGYSGLAATQDEIKNLVSQIRASPNGRKQNQTSSSTLQHLTAVSSETALTVSNLINIRMNAAQYARPPRSWTIELLTRWSTLPLQTFPRHPKQTIPNPGYLLILKASADQIWNGLTVPNRDDKYFPGSQVVLEIQEPRQLRNVNIEHGMEYELVREEQPRRSHNKTQMIILPSPSEESGLRERETARKAATYSGEVPVQMSQQETETAVNDFLATLSALYDDVPAEERTKVLDSVPLRVGGEEGFESDGDSSKSSEAT